MDSMRIGWLAAASVSIATWALSAGAQAAAIVRTYDLHATNFVQTFGADPTPPQASVNLKVTLTFDNSGDVATTTSGLVVDSFDLPYGVEYSYVTFGGLTDFILLGTSLPGFNTCEPGHGAFCAFIFGATGATPSLNLFTNSLNTYPQNVWTAESRSMAYSDAAGPRDGGVPEPSVWAMMLMGFGGLGAMLRRRRPSLARAG
jgi:hypothetical protein